jgi:hypothetical protein
LRLYWEANDFARTSLELRGVADVKNGELLGEATFSRQLRFIHDDLSFKLITQWIRPDRQEQTLFSFFPDNNSNVRVRMGFDF